jgi:NADH:ubiquinone oxidoreductase subunit E
MTKKKQPAAAAKWPPELVARLREAQEGKRGLTRETLAGVAEAAGLLPHEVYGVATFYSFLGAKPRGRNIIRICRSLPCHLKDYEMVAAAIEKKIGIEPGETTEDGRFTFELTNCIGLCDQAPAMLVNEDPHGYLTPQKISQILDGYK